MKIPHRLSAAAMLCLLASGCSTLERVDATEKRADGFEAQADAHKRAMESGQVVRDLTTQWINPVPLSGLPGQRSELPPCAVKINRLGSVSLAYVSAFITDQCRIPVVVTPDAQAAMSGSDGGGKTEKISGPLCVMTITAATWGDSPETVTRNLTLLQQALTSWGICGVTQTFGDPVKAWVATLTASSAASGPCLMYPPLSEALNLMPLTRPTTAWSEEGNAMFISPDGRLMPVALAASNQTKKTTIVAGESGGGKSVLIKRQSIILAMSAQKQLPFYAGIDKGFSSVGMVSILHAGLPPERHDEVLSIILRNDATHCRNLFDIQLGLTAPLSYESTFMLNALSALCIDPGTGIPPNGRDSPMILRRLVSDSFKACREDPRRYEPGLVPEVDTALSDAGIWEAHPDYRENASWYEVRDLLQDAGHTVASQRAQFQAVPELADMAPRLLSEDYRSMYGNIQRDGSNEPLIEYIARCLRDACAQYRMFAGRTRFMISPKARVITVDIQYVAGDKSPAGYLQTGMMYLFAGHIAGGDFVLPQYQDELFPELHERWHAIHRARVQQLDEEVKTKQYDELHNAKGVPFSRAARRPLEDANAHANRHEP